MGSVKMSALNKQLMEFLSGHISNDASCNLVPVFDDYCTHVSDISAKCGSQVETQPGTLEAAVGASPASASAGKQCQFMVLLLTNQEWEWCAHTMSWYCCMCGCYTALVRKNLHYSYFLCNWNKSLVTVLQWCVDCIGHWSTYCITDMYICSVCTFCQNYDNP